MLTLINPGIVPNPGYFQVRHPVTGHHITSPNIKLIFRAYQDYCRANDLEVPNNAKITELMCQQKPEICHDRVPPSVPEMVVSAMKDLTTWVIQGMPIAKGEVLASRLKICEVCENWTGMHGGNFLQGGCRACGCAGIKLGLESSKCIIGKW